MTRQRGKNPTLNSPSSLVTPSVWLRAEYVFASTFSYRIPDASSQFAPGVPIPPPATVKLALVDTAIRWSGQVQEGRRIFDIVKTLAVHVVPPPQVARFRVFLRRLKKPHSESGPWAPTEESTGMRDYFLFSGPLSVYICVPDQEKGTIQNLLYRIRRFGTSDSLCFCLSITQEEPIEGLCPHRLLDSPRAQGLITVLTNLTSDSQFDGFNPFRDQRKRTKLAKEVYALPLRVKRSGANWTIFERIEP